LVAEVFLKRKYHKFIAKRLSAACHSISTLSTITLFLAFSLTSGHIFGQDLRFSQWHASQSMVNPAFAGAFGNARLALNFRDQWPAMPQTYVSYRAAFDGYFEPIRSGMGVSVVRDDQGDGLLSMTELGWQYMFQARLGYDWALNIGASLDYTQFKINWSDVQLYDQISLLTGFNDAVGNPNPTAEGAPAAENSGFMDLGLGLLLYSERLYAGMSFQHLNTPVVSFYNNGDAELPASLGLQTGVFIGGAQSDDLLLNPYALWTLQNGFNQIQAGLYAKKQLVLAGLSFKHNTLNISDIVLMVGMAKGIVRFGYSYDISTGALAGLTGGAHEVSLTLTFEQPAGKAKKQAQKNMLDCPGVL